MSTVAKIASIYDFPSKRLKWNIIDMIYHRIAHRKDQLHVKDLEFEKKNHKPFKVFLDLGMWLSKIKNKIALHMQLYNCMVDNKFTIFGHIFSHRNQQHLAWLPQKLIFLRSLFLGNVQVIFYTVWYNSTYFLGDDQSRFYIIWP